MDTVKAMNTPYDPSEYHAKRLASYLNRMGRAWLFAFSDHTGKFVRMPSKDAKHRAYSDGYSLARARGLDVAPGGLNTLNDLIGVLDKTGFGHKLAATNRAEIRRVTTR
jgi:hypothetical protein